MTPRRPLLTALAVGAVVVVIDQLTKRWALNRLGLGPCRAEADNCIDLVWTLRLNLVENPGAAFSTGENLGPLFGLIAAIMTVVLLNVARTRTDRWGPLLLGLIAGGAVGNLVDRLTRAEDGLASGSVVDFIDLQWWPVFNVADSAVVVGVVALVILSLFEAEAEAEDEAEDQGRAAAPGEDAVEDEDAVDAACGDEANTEVKHDR